MSQIFNITRIPLFLFTILASKAMFLSASWSDAAVILVVGAIATAYEFKSRDKEVERLDKLVEKQNETILAMAKSLDEVRSSVSGIKMAQGMRSSNVGRI